MLQHPLGGPGRGSFMTGRSVHYQRIEHLWRDLFHSELHCSILQSFLSDGGYENVDNEIHMFCLHYVFIPRINCAISQFLDGWNQPPLCSMGNLLPVQLWIAGLSRASAAECVSEVGKMIDML